MADNTVKSIFETEPDEEEEARLDAAADAEIEAGQFVTHDRVVDWLQSWASLTSCRARSRSRVEQSRLVTALAHLS